MMAGGERGEVEHVDVSPNDLPPRCHLNLGFKQNKTQHIIHNVFFD